MKSENLNSLMWVGWLCDLILEGKYQKIVLILVIHSKRQVHFFTNDELTPMFH